jgi:streptomycin 3"-adenylyltransferase
MPSVNACVPHSIRAQVRQACDILQQHLATTLVGIYLFGSAVDGGLKPLSDVDLLVTVASPPSAATRHALMAALLRVSAPPGTADLRALEVTVLALPEIVPWRYGPRRELQFGEWLRDEIQAGVFEGPVPDPDLAILLTKLRQGSIALLGDDASAVFDAVPRDDLVRALLDTVAQWNGPPDWAGDERNIVLALARIWYTAETGAIASKDAAAAWLLERWEKEPHRAVLKQARAAYLGFGKDELAKQPDAVACFIRDARVAIEALCAAPG